MDIKDIWILIESSSCKTNGFGSENFKNELEKLFSGSQYRLEIEVYTNPQDGYFKNGCSRIEVADVSEEELDKIHKLIANAFQNLKST